MRTSIFLNVGWLLLRSAVWHDAKDLNTLIQMAVTTYMK